jgi:hypothetical protein
VSRVFADQTKGFLGEEPKKLTYDYMVIEDRVHKIHKVIVHRFTMGDVEDPILYAAEPLIQWQNSEQGQWVMEHAVETPEWNRYADTLNWGHSFYITAKLKAKDYSFFLLKWGEGGTLK